MGPRAGLDGCGKSRPPPGFDPRTVQLVAHIATAKDTCIVNDKNLAPDISTLKNCVRRTSRKSVIRVRQNILGYFECQFIVLQLREIAWLPRVQNFENLSGNGV